ncbi:hypothetical protein [Mesorhizobium sp. AA23]|uniref:hypothetical protein n=1 Tax=Mesorhizobium sp. AA23 TaxID=1854058 RepID=UPI0012EAC16F|nr:hypothetical protein [Mesorhizobium sp. AA23]
MAASKDDWKAFRAELRRQLDLERRFIENAESGRTGIWHEHPGKGRVDATAGHIEMAKQAAAVLEGVIAKIDTDHLAD